MARNAVPIPRSAVLERSPRCRASSTSARVRGSHRRATRPTDSQSAECSRHEDHRRGDADYGEFDWSMPLAASLRDGLSSSETENRREPVRDILDSACGFRVVKCHRFERLDRWYVLRTGHAGMQWNLDRLRLCELTFDIRETAGNRSSCAPSSGCGALAISDTIFGMTGTPSPSLSGRTIPTG